MQDQNFFYDTPLLDQIINYCSNPKTPFHMPGHAGGKALHPKILEFFGENIFKADLTELDEMDNLQDPQGVIKYTQDKISRIFNSKASYMLINGSTLGLMALILAVSKEGDKIIIPRNCHRSIINGLILTGAFPIWLMPDWLKDWQLFGAVSPESLDCTLEKHPGTRAVFVTNPTYEGIVSDIKSLKEVCLKYDVPLIVDEAHGSHWRFSDKFPEDSLSLGADAVVQSFHKSSGSLSQSSLLHISKESKISSKMVEESLRILQSTSPSYLLMASLDAATSFMMSDKGNECLKNIYNESLNLRNRLEQLPDLELLKPDDCFVLDPTRLFLRVKGLTGLHLANILEEEYNIAIESYNNIGNLFFLNIGNTPDQINHLYNSLDSISCKSHSDTIPSLEQPIRPKMITSPRKAYLNSKSEVLISDALNKIAAFPISKCPPCTLILTPGELITEQHFQFFDQNEKVHILKSDSLSYNSCT